MGKLKRHFNEVITPTWNFSGRLNTPEDHQQNALIGLAAEAGEVLDVGKKMWFHTEKPFKEWRGKLISELGDVLYYFLKAMDIFNISWKELLEANREKLASRHPELGKVAERWPEGYIR